MTGAAATIAADPPGTRAGLSVGSLVAALLGLFAVDNLLLLHFWGLPLPLTAALMFVAVTAISALSTRLSTNLPPVPYHALGVAFVIAMALFALGGQGRFFYANIDWQVRDAVLHDMATNPWPFAYDVNGSAYFLRAPLGTYLLPAMFGANADIALWLSNSIRLALLLTLAWHLFESKRERIIALWVFFLFSGWDLLGTAVYSALGQHLSWDHIEQWNLNYQYSSNVTLAFWVPQHAIAGWTCTVAFVLWRKGLMPVGLLAASIPLVVIWSPLAIMGAVPFAVLAGFEVRRRRGFGLNDIAIAALALVLAVPALLYLQIDAANVGMHLRPTHPLIWAFCVALEVLPFAWPLLRDRTPAVDRPVILLTLLLLLVMPLVQIGVSSDFQMRASIMPLALLAVYFARWLIRLRSQKPLSIAVVYASLAIGLGAATPLLEFRRAVADGPSPPPLCSLAGVWTRQDNMIVPYSTYLAPVSELPPRIPHPPVLAGRSDPDRCWGREWPIPEGWPARSKD